ncbi:hypothetical protein ACFRCX_30840 [Streptomyces sp. NPDC056652]|uniref:hypothetical protein n=1 Tax=Streptomyces sp. NPDC056652 TaxID=3345893 RepID=UPI0036C98D23
MTTTPNLPAPDSTTPGTGPQDPADGDVLLAGRCETSGEYLAGVIAAGMLDHVGRPDRLPELLWPDADPAVVRAVWEAGLATGYRAGKLAAHPEWTGDGLNRLRAALYEAGYRGMGRLAARSAAVHQTHPARTVPNAVGHPADSETPGDRAAVRQLGGQP